MSVTRTRRRWICTTPSPRHGLAVGADHARDLLVGVAGSYLVAAGRDDALVLEEPQQEAGQSFRDLLVNQIGGPVLAEGQALVGEARDRSSSNNGDQVCVKPPGAGRQSG